jgi:CubicO group peptidase (beta-lactamase class C family)
MRNTVLSAPKRLSRRAVTLGLSIGGALGLAKPAASALAPPPPPILTRIPGGVVRPLPVASKPLVAASALSDAQAISDRFGGSSLLVWKSGGLIYEHYAPGFDASTPLPTFSMAKSVLGLAYGLAVDRGVLNIHDPVSNYIEEWRGDPRGAITLIEFLQMRSGLHLYSMGLGEAGAYTLMFGRDITSAALQTPLDHPPGEMFEYENINAFIAGLALQRALTKAGRGPYTDFLSRELWRPLGQADATVDVDGPSGVPRFFAGLNATARDWLRLGRLFVEQGRVDGRQVVSAAWLKTMTAPSPNPSYGLLMWRGSPWVPLRSYGPRTPMKVACKEPFLADDMVYFDGAGGQRVYAAPSLDLVIVRTGKQSLEWDDSALPNTLIRGLL